MEGVRAPKFIASPTDFENAFLVFLLEKLKDNKYASP